MRGAPEDFETWASWGNTEWSYALCRLPGRPPERPGASGARYSPALAGAGQAPHDIHPHRIPPG